MTEHRLTAIHRCFFVPLNKQIGNISISRLRWGDRGGAVGSGTVLQVGRSRVPFSMVSLGFSIDIILPAAIWPWGRLNL